MGRAAINVGENTGSELYNVMLEQLHHMCPGGDKGSCKYLYGEQPTHHVEDAKINGAWVIGDCESGKFGCSVDIC
jgi:hypothetical protein